MLIEVGAERYGEQNMKQCQAELALLYWPRRRELALTKGLSKVQHGHPIVITGLSTEIK